MPQHKEYANTMLPISLQQVVGPRWSSFSVIAELGLMSMLGQQTDPDGGRLTPPVINSPQMV